MFDRLHMPFFMYDAETGDGNGGDTPPADEAPEPDKTDWKAEAEKWKSFSRKHEDQAKANHAELEKLRQAQMSDQEKAINEAMSKGRAEAVREFSERLAVSEIKGALAGVVPDPSAIVEDLNISKYVGEDGNVLSDKVNALRERYSKLAPAKRESLDLGQGKGKNSNGDKPQLSQADLNRMSAEQISAAHKAGQLDQLLGAIK